MKTSAKYTRKAERSVLALLHLSGLPLGSIRRQFFALFVTLMLSLGVLGPVEAASGDLDPTFETDGKVTTDFAGGFDAATALAIQNDGKVVAAGLALDENFEAVVGLVRYETNGNLDPTFGNGGKVGIDLSPVFTDNIDVGIQADGKIVVVATVGDWFQTDIGVARVDANGNPDPAFGIGGKVTTDFFGASDAANAVAFQSDGKIVVAGTAGGVSSVTDFAVVRYNTDGSLDTSFGTAGKVTTDILGAYDKANDVAIQADGKIVAAGAAAPNFTYRRYVAIARYDADGALDTSFDTDGKVTVNISEQDEARAVAIQPADGRIVIAGGAVVPNNIGSFTDFLLMRFDTNGAPDPGFGSGGMVITDFLGAGDYANDVAIQADGRIVAAGWVSDPVEVELNRDFGLARYDADGALDSTFGAGGLAMTDFQFTDYGYGVAIQQDCKIVAAGYSWDVESGDSNFALARYDSDGCEAEQPGGPCPLSHGHWKNTPDIWPVSALTLGAQSYSKAELLNLLTTSSQTDASVTLARQLIAAKLNVAGGADSAPVAGTIAHADGILAAFGGKLPYKVKSSSAVGQAMTADTVVLTSYNNGLLTPGCTQ